MRISVSFLSSGSRLSIVSCNDVTSHSAIRIDHDPLDLASLQNLVFSWIVSVLVQLLSVRLIIGVTWVVCGGGVTTLPFFQHLKHLIL